MAEIKDYRVEVYYSHNCTTQNIYTRAFSAEDALTQVRLQISLSFPTGEIKSVSPIEPTWSETRE